MHVETLSEDDKIIICRMILTPGEASEWHTDACRRFTVIVTGDRLGIEYRDTDDLVEFDVSPGLTGWDQPEVRIHRAVNLGNADYHEVVTFYRDSGIDPQPTADT